MMNKVIGSGVIQVSVDGTAVKAGIDDAKHAISSLGEANEKASARSARSIDNYIKRLDLQNQTLGKSTREIELYKLKLKGASEEQIRAADSALKLAESQRKSADNLRALKTGLIAITAVATSAAYAIYSLSDRMISQIANYQDIAEKIGDTAVNVASLKLASDLSGVALDSVAAASIKLTVALAKTDDEASMAGAAIHALGLDFNYFKSLEIASDHFLELVQSLGFGAVPRAWANQATRRNPSLVPYADMPAHQMLMAKKVMKVEGVSLQTLQSGLRETLRLLQGKQKMDM